MTWDIAVYLSFHSHLTTGWEEKEQMRERGVSLTFVHKEKTEYSQNLPGQSQVPLKPSLKV